MRTGKEDVHGLDTECMSSFPSDAELINRNRWDPVKGTVTKPSYFQKPSEGTEYDFVTDFWRRRCLSIVPFC